MAFDCLFCGLSHPTADALRMHKLRIHGVPREYPCTLCDKVFSRQDVCKKHMRLNCPNRNNVEVGNSASSSLMVEQQPHSSRYVRRSLLSPIVELREERSRSRSPQVDEQSAHPMVNVNVLSFSCGFCRRVFDNQAEFNGHTYNCLVSHFSAPEHQDTFSSLMADVKSRILADDLDVSDDE